MLCFVSHLIYLISTKTTSQQCFHPSAKHLLYRYITRSFAGHSFRVKGETSYICQFIVVHFDLISNIFLCRYASRTLRIKILTWCRVVSRSRLGLKFVKIFRACIQNFSITLRATFVFFRDLDLLCSPQHSNFYEWSDYGFSSCNYVCKHSCVVAFSAVISLTLFLRRCQRWGNQHRDGVGSKTSITHGILDLFEETYKPAFDIYRSILESFFMP